MKRLTAVVCAVAALLPFTATTAVAATERVSVTTVSLDGLDLSRAEALRTAETRIARAARRVCNSHGRTTLAERRLDAECRIEAERLARLDLSRTAAHAAKNRVQLRASR